MIFFFPKCTVINGIINITHTSTKSFTRSVQFSFFKATAHISKKNKKKMDWYSCYLFDENEMINWSIMFNIFESCKHFKVQNICCHMLFITCINKITRIVFSKVLDIIFIDKYYISLDHVNI